MLSVNYETWMFFCDFCVLRIFLVLIYPLHNRQCSSWLGFLGRVQETGYLHKPVHTLHKQGQKIGRKHTGYIFFSHGNRERGRQCWKHGSAWDYICGGYLIYPWPYNDGNSSLERRRMMYFMIVADTGRSNITQIAEGHRRNLSLYIYREKEQKCM